MPESVDTQATEKVAPTDATETINATDIGEEIRPYVHRLMLPEVKDPLILVTLLYLVRQGHEDEDAKLLEVAARRAKLRGGFTRVRDGFPHSDRTDADDIAVLYNELPDQEKERVWNFAHDAEARGANLDRQRDFAILEAFTTFLWEDLEAEPAQVMEWMTLTQEQYDTYKAAWQMLQGVYNQKWRLTEGEENNQVKNIRRIE